MLPELPWERNRIWICAAPRFTRARRVAYAIVDVVTREWIGYLLSSEQSSTQAQLLFTDALSDQGLLGPDGTPLAGDDGPIVVAWSDNGAEMTATDTRAFVALMTIAQHHGRPGTPDRPGARGEFLQPPRGRLAAPDPIADPGALDTELARLRAEYNTVRLHAAIGYVTPDDEHHGCGPAIRRARAAGLTRARAARIKHNRRRQP